MVPEDQIAPDQSERWSRRSVIAGVAGSTLAGAAAFAALRGRAFDGNPFREGISDRPVTSRHALWTLHDLSDRSIEWVGSLGNVAALATHLAHRLAVHPDGDGVALMVGLGPRLVKAVDRNLPGADALPEFRHDTMIAPSARGGDLAVVLESDGPIPPALARWAATALPGLLPRWSLTGHRSSPRARNPIGFHDEVVIPHTLDELQDHVVIPDGPAAGGTMCVVRLLSLDVDRFSALGVDQQQAVVGRRRDNGAPLSGASIGDAVDLQARSPDGTLLIPERSHVRAAHPMLARSSLMLRRSYDVADTSLEPVPANPRTALTLFVSYQRTLDGFVATQQRLDSSDDLMDFVRPLASAAFLVLPEAGSFADGPFVASTPARNVT